MQNKKTKEETNAQTVFFNTKDPYNSNIYDNDSSIVNHLVHDRFSRCSMPTKLIFFCG